MIDTERLRILRGNKKQCSVAEAVGISQNHYSQIEKGIKMPSLDVAMRIADYYGVGLDSITSKNPTPPPATERPVASAAGAVA